MRLYDALIHSQCSSHPTIDGGRHAPCLEKQTAVHSKLQQNVFRTPKKGPILKLILITLSVFYIFPALPCHQIFVVTDKISNFTSQNMGVPGLLLPFFPFNFIKLVKYIKWIRRMKKKNRG